MDRNETLADLAEAVRKMARDMEENADWENDVIVVDHTLVEGFNNLADRIGAAAKREELRWAKANGDLARMLDLEKAQGGNAARLRAAVEGIEMLLGAVGDLDRKELAEECARALAAPPRNCDRFATAEDALTTYDRERDTIRTGEPGMAEYKWLFSLATPEK